MALIGKTGVGKTTLLYNMAFADLSGGTGVSRLSTPTAPLSPISLGVVYRSRTNDVILLNPAANHSRIMGINPLIGWAQRAASRGVVCYKNHQESVAHELGSVMDPKIWTQKWPFLRWWAALKMKESQCPERERVTRPA